MRVVVHHGDCLDVLRGMGEASVDAVCTDPPYHLTSIVKRFGAEGAAPAKSDGATGVYGRASAGFMGKRWDGGDIAFRPETWAEMIRVMKPGAYMAAFASTRGYHRMVCAIEDAGFIIHPMLGWLFATGFPKAHKVEAEGWEGWRYGLQSLKPALEPICLAQKPMREKTGTAQVLATGTGALNIAATKVPSATPVQKAAGSPGFGAERADGYEKGTGREYGAAGRWPANLCHDGSPEVLAAFGRFGERGGGPSARSTRGPRRQGSGWERPCNAGHEAGSIGLGDTGTAARFFPALGFGEDELRFMYSAKASRADRCGSKHPTVKPVALMRWLCRLVTPPGGVVLDPFAGSGATGEAALREGFSAVLIEREAEYVADIHARLARYRDEAPLLAEVAA